MYSVSSFIFKEPPQCAVEFVGDESEEDRDRMLCCPYPLRLLTIDAFLDLRFYRLGIQCGIKN